MSTAQDVYALRVLRAWNETPTARAIVLDRGGAALEAQYTTPGQYVQLSVQGNPPYYFSMASPPEASGVLEFLIRRQGDVAGALADVAEGDTVHVSRVLGSGFPVDRVRGADVLLFATGSGIAPIRAVMGHMMINRGLYGAVSLYYGARNRDEIAFGNELSLWEAADIAVNLVLSQASETWRGHRGYVQHLLARHEGHFAGATALVCGQGSMVDEVSQTLGGLGVPAEHIYKNF